LQAELPRHAAASPQTEQHWAVEVQQKVVQ
jgi:hypothetical protein